MVSFSPSLNNLSYHSTLSFSTPIVDFSGTLVVSSMAFENEVLFPNPKTFTNASFDEGTEELRNDSSLSALKKKIKEALSESFSFLLLLPQCILAADFQVSETQLSQMNRTFCVNGVNLLLTSKLVVMCLVSSSSPSSSSFSGYTDLLTLATLLIDWHDVSASSFLCQCIALTHCVYCGVSPFLSDLRMLASGAGAAPYVH